MSTELVPFDYGNQPVRVVVIDGEPWFVLADLCKVLGISNVGNVAARLDGAGVRQTDIRSGGQTRAVTIVSEPGMYEVVIRSDKAEAVAFRRWITGEVLPSIRKTGSYGRPVVDGNAITRMELIEIARNAELERLALEAENRELAPKAEAFDSFLDATGKYGVGAVAKMLGTSQNKLFRELRNRGVFIAKGSMRNTPYQQYMHHFEVIPHDFERSNGEMGCSYTTYVQPSGIDFIRRKLGLPTIDPLPADEAGQLTLGETP
ncbi:phage antirepressor [Mycolicibacterium mageritense]|uniref:phage antirepressor n=1 Tax=Mycolicibacterium mageritense TaxID=53462 RepID=UPI001E455C97|nr:phage antirepressor [Mycolicibacterium mageritense]GJJ21091.1 antirepressor [Mycolicibacterium mageritense]